MGFMERDTVGAIAALDAADAAMAAYDRLVFAAVGRGLDAAAADALAIKAAEACRKVAKFWAEPEWLLAMYRGYEADFKSLV